MHGGWLGVTIAMIYAKSQVLDVVNIIWWAFPRPSSVHCGEWEICEITFESAPILERYSWCGGVKYAMHFYFDVDYNMVPSPSLPELWILTLHWTVVIGTQLLWCSRSCIGGSAKQIIFARSSGKQWMYGWMAVHYLYIIMFIVFITRSPLYWIN